MTNHPTPINGAKPSPQLPAAGLSQHAAEMRRRIVADLLPHFTDVDELLTIANWVAYGDEEEQ